MVVLKFLSISFLFIVTYAPESGCNKQNDKSQIIWKKNKKLEWKDFEGVVPQNNRDNTALSRISISLKYKDNDEIKKVSSSSIFSKDFSWVKVRTEEALKHEQVHFDLTEYCRRILQNKIDSIINSNRFITRLQIQSLSETADVMHKEMQHEYDDETEHGLRRIMQIKWEEEVEKSLKQTE